MGVRKCFSLWFTIPSEQGWCGCTDWSRTSHCKTPHNWRAFLPPTDSISPHRKLGQGQHNSEVLHTSGISAWYWWHDGIVQGQMDYTTTAGLVMPCLTCPCCWDESSLWFCMDANAFCWGTSKLVSRLHLSVTSCSQYALMKGVSGVQQRASKHFQNVYISIENANQLQ